MIEITGEPRSIRERICVTCDKWVVWRMNKRGEWVCQGCGSVEPATPIPPANPAGRTR